MLSATALNIAISLIIRCNRDCSTVGGTPLPIHDGWARDRCPPPPLRARRKLRQYTDGQTPVKGPSFARWRGLRPGKDVLYTWAWALSSRVTRFLDNFRPLSQYVRFVVGGRVSPREEPREGSRRCTCTYACSHALHHVMKRECQWPPRATLLMRGSLLSFFFPLLFAPFPPLALFLCAERRVA